jgi:CHASE3 domain sensor protein
MDNQLNTLLESYSSNYLQYRITGDQKYSNAYNAALQGLDSLIYGMKIMLYDKPQIEALRKDLKRNKEATIRNANSLSTDIPSMMPSFSTTQYTVIGVLGGLICLLYII